MASSGTVSLSIDTRFKPGRGREEAMVTGRMHLKSTAVVEAADLRLRTIKTFLPLPYSPGAAQDPPQVFGSVASAGSLANNVTLKVLRGSVAAPRGTVHVGTVPAGTMYTGFMALGA